MRWPRTTGASIAALHAIVLLMLSAIHAENIIFPRFKAGLQDVSGITDVTLPPYSADNTGATDVTAVLQQALDDQASMYTIYLPNGTYLVSNTLTWQICDPGAGTCVQGPRMQGQSRTGTVIRLQDNTFTSAGSPKNVIQTGGGVAQDMFRGLHNLTVNVGSNNPGANGVFWYGNNESLMSDIDIISEDGQGNVGLNLGSGEQGPCGARDVYVNGFAIGCQSDALNSVTVWNLSLEGQSQYGVRNQGNTLYIDSLTSVNSVTAVRVAGGNVTLTNARLTGGASGNSAVSNGAYLFARNISAEGYGSAISSTSGSVSTPSGLVVDEFSSHGQTGLFNSPTTSMGLPYAPIPHPTWEQDTTKWGNIKMYKGGLGVPTRSDQEAFQAAIDDPKNTSVCIPGPALYEIVGDVYVRGNISRIVGTFGRLGGSGRLIITSDGTAPVIKVERILGVPIVNQSDKTVILESVLGTVTSTGTGDLFLSDVVGDFIIDNPNQRVWAWQFDAEGGQDCIDNHINLEVIQASTVRVFGWKDEGCGTSAVVRSGAVEILGFLYYSYLAHTCCNSGIPGSWDHEFAVEDAGQFCLAGAHQVYFSGSGFSNLVTVTRGTETTTLTSSQNPNGQTLPLFTAYDPALVPSTGAVETPRGTPLPVGMRVLADRGAVIVKGAWSSGYPARVEIFSVTGACVRSAGAPTCADGTLRVEGLSRGVYAVQLTSGSTRHTVTTVVPALSR